MEIKKGFIVRFELLGIIVGLLLQTIAAVWWAAGTSTMLQVLKQEVIDVKIKLDSQYKAADAGRDFSIRDQKISFLEREIEAIKVYLEKREARLTAVERRVKS